MTSIYSRNSYVPHYFPEPSAPYLDEDDDIQPSAPPMEEEFPQRAIDLDEDCSICLEGFRSNPEGDSRSVTVLSKTECNHFFHEFCLSKHLQSGMNKNCPYCRHSLAGANKVTTINLSNPAVSPFSQTDQTPSYFLIGVMAIAKEVSSAVAETLKFLGTLAFNTAKWGISTAVKAVSVNPKALSDKVVNFFKNWEKNQKDFDATMQTTKEELSVLLATVNSLPASRSTQSSINRIERKTAVFEQKIKELQKDFRDYIRSELRAL